MHMRRNDAHEGGATIHMRRDDAYEGGATMHMKRDDAHKEGATMHMKRDDAHKEGATMHMREAQRCTKGSAHQAVPNPCIPIPLLVLVHPRSATCARPICAAMQLQARRAPPAQRRQLGNTKHACTPLPCCCVAADTQRDQAEPAGGAVHLKAKQACHMFPHSLAAAWLQTHSVTRRSLLVVQARREAGAGRPWLLRLHRAACWTGCWSW